MAEHRRRGTNSRAHVGGGVGERIWTTSRRNKSKSSLGLQQSPRRIGSIRPHLSQKRNAGKIEAVKRLNYDSSPSRRGPRRLPALSLCTIGHIEASVNRRLVTESGLLVHRLGSTWYGRHDECTGRWCCGCGGRHRDPQVRHRRLCRGCHGFGRHLDPQVQCCLGPAHTQANTFGPRALWSSPFISAACTRHRHGLRAKMPPLVRVVLQHEA